MNNHDLTIQTYDQSAPELAAFFRGMGARIDYFERALALSAAKPGTAKVVEIGCGDGRDAIEITKRVGHYQGFDRSAGLLKIARETLPDVDFIQTDALSFTYSKDLDVIFAFASLLHIDRNDLGRLFRKMADNVRSGCIVFGTFKERDEYAAELKTDTYGQRMFYYYSLPLLLELAGDNFELVYEDRTIIGSTDWLTIALRRR